MATAHRYEVINLGSWPTVKSDIPASVRLSLAGQLGANPQILLPGHILMTRVTRHSQIVEGWIERVRASFGRGEHPILHLELREAGKSAGFPILKMIPHCLKDGNSQRHVVFYVGRAVYRTPER